MENNFKERCLFISLHFSAVMGRLIFEIFWLSQFRLSLSHHFLKLYFKEKFNNFLKLGNYYLIL